jgi:ferredoxin
MKAMVDKEACIGCGVCQEECDSVFTMDKDDKATAIEGDIPADQMDAAMSAKDVCPVEAITIV